MIYIGLYQGRSFWPSKCIKWFSWSRYSHVSVIQILPKLVLDLSRPGVHDLVDLNIIEAWPGGVRETHSYGSGHSEGTKIDLYEFVDELTYSEECDLMARMRSQIGKPYDWKGVFAFLLRVRCHDIGSWFCSELVAWACRMINRILFRKKDYQAMPGDFSVTTLLRYAFSVTTTRKKHEDDI